jgi:Tol biopolymer transport system component
MSEQENDILARVRAANPVVADEDRGRAAVAQLALARILEDPVALADRRGAERPRRRVRATLAAVPALIAAIVTIAVAGVVLTSVRHHQPSAPVRPAVAARNGKVAVIAGGSSGFFGPTRLEHGVTWALNALGVSNPDGSGRQKVGAYRCATPTYACGVDSFAWSANGTQIAYLAGHPTSPNAPTSLAVYLVDADGNDSRQLASCGACTGPSWSPDGSRIALTRATRQVQDLWLVNVKTGTLTRLTHCAWGKGCADEGAEWSPDGQAIVFSRSGNGHVPSIYTVRPDGTHLRRIAVGALAPQWSPDGRKITFQTRNGIYTVNADGMQLTHIVAAVLMASGPSWSLGPSWSPDGTKLLYSASFLNADALEVTQLWTINANGSNKRRVYQGVTARENFDNLPTSVWSPEWSPDGKQIAAETNGGTLVMNADGTDVHRVGEPAGQVAWQPMPITRR